MGNSNSEEMCQQNVSMAKEYCGFVEERGDVNGRVQPLKLVEYHSKKETSLYPAVFVIVGCFSLSLEYNHYHLKSGICVVQSFATLIPSYTFLFFSPL